MNADRSVALAALIVTQHLSCVPQHTISLHFVYMSATDLIGCAFDQKLPWNSLKLSEADLRLSAFICG
jgi:hypothetical protein